MANETDRIEKQITLRAPRSQVWRALTDSAQFSSWFGVKISGAFEPGARIEGTITHPGYEHIPFVIDIDRVQPETLLSWRWHPGSADPGFDYSKEPPTYVAFELSDVPEGTLLKVVESGFDALPMPRRIDAFRGNSDGWTSQMKNIQKHVEG